MKQNKAPPLRILSLDGGGVKGLTSLLLLRSIFQSVQGLVGKDVHPHEYFDLIAGTSTGGLIAIMLGRLHMSIDESIEAYKTLSPTIFKKKWWSNIAALKILGAEMNRNWFQGKNLEEAIRSLLCQKQMDPDIELLELGDPRCKVFVCAVDAHSSNVQLLRSYKSTVPGQFNYECSIWEAARATSAAPLFFEPITLREGGFTFVDGAVRANNPIEEVVNEAHVLWPNREIGCLLSLGTGVTVRRGFHPKKNSLHAVLGSLAKIAIDANAKHIAFKNTRDGRQLIEKQRYFRFSVAEGVSNIKMSEFEKLPIMQAATIQYTAEVSKEIEECGRKLASYDEDYTDAGSRNLNEDSDDSPDKFLTFLDIDWTKSMNVYQECFGAGVSALLQVTLILCTYNKISSLLTLAGGRGDLRPVGAQLSTTQLFFQVQCFLLLSSAISDQAAALHEFIYSREKEPSCLLQSLRCTPEQAQALERLTKTRIHAIFVDYESNLARILQNYPDGIHRIGLSQLQKLNFELHALVRSKSNLAGLGSNHFDAGPMVDSELSKMGKINALSRNIQTACKDLWSCEEHPVHSASIKLAIPTDAPFRSRESQNLSVSFDLLVTTSPLHLSTDPVSFEITCSTKENPRRPAEGVGQFLDQDGYLHDSFPTEAETQLQSSSKRRVGFVDEVAKEQFENNDSANAVMISKPLCALCPADFKLSKASLVLGAMDTPNAAQMSIQLMEREGILGVAMSHLPWLQFQTTPTRVISHMNKVEKMRFAAQLAELVLAHHSTSWLAHTFSNTHVALWGSQSPEVHLSAPYLYHQPDLKGKSPVPSKEQPRDPWVKNKILFGLGVLLLELEYEMPIESIIASISSRENHPTSSDVSLAEQLLVVKHIAGNEMGTSYGRIVRMCLDCDFGLGLREYSLRDTMLQRRYYTQVLLEFRELIPRWEKIYSLCI